MCYYLISSLDVFISLIPTTRVPMSTVQTKNNAPCRSGDNDRNSWKQRSLFVNLLEFQMTVLNCLHPDDYPQRIYALFFFHSCCVQNVNITPTHSALPLHVSSVEKPIRNSFILNISITYLNILEWYRKCFFRYIRKKPGHHNEIQLTRFIPLILTKR